MMYLDLVYQVARLIFIYPYLAIRSWVKGEPLPSFWFSLWFIIGATVAFHTVNQAMSSILSGRKESKNQND